MTAEVEIVINAQDNFSGVLGNFSLVVSGIRDAIDLVGMAFDAASEFIQPFIDSASESELALVGLQNVLESTGDAAGLTVEQLTSMSTQLQGITMFSDEQIQNAETMLLRFEGLNEIFPQALQLTTDLAASLGTDLTSAARMVGMALDDPEAGIGRLNTQFRIFTAEQMDVIKAMAASGDVAGAQALIMQGLTEKVGGAAAAFGQTFAGQLEIAKNKLDDVKEVIGGALLPVLTDLLTKFSEFVTSPVVTEFVDSFLNGFQNVDIAGFLANIDWKTASQNLSDGIKNIDWVAVGNAIRTGLNAALVGIDFLLNTVLKTAIQNIDWAAVASAMGSAITGIIAGAFGYVDWDALMVDFKNGFVYIGQQALTALASTFGYDSWARFANDVKNGFNYVIDTIKDFLGISSPSTVFASIGRDIVNGLIAGWDATIGQFLTAIGNTIEDIGSLFGIDLSGLLGGGASASGLGTAGGGTAGGSAGGTTGPQGGSSGSVINNYYGPVYFGAAGEPGAYYDCPSPNPLVAMSGNQLVTTGF